MRTNDNWRNQNVIFFNIFSPLHRIISMCFGNWLAYVHMHSIPILMSKNKHSLPLQVTSIDEVTNENAYVLIFVSFSICLCHIPSHFIFYSLFRSRTILLLTLFTHSFNSLLKWCVRSVCATNRHTYKR